MAGAKLFSVIGFLVVIICVFWLLLTHPMKKQNSSMHTVAIAGVSVHVSVADTEALRERGLSGHAPLATDEGMLFTFDMPATYGFWMKDMHFPIDIVWLDASGTVVTIKANATPESYPEVFLPDAPASFVLELPSGFAAAHHLAPGDHAAL